jgi:hypothetical protein
MSLTTRVCVFAALVLAGAVVWHNHLAADSAQEATQLAVQQFHNDDGVVERLQQTALAQNWWPLLGPGLAVLLGVVMFWDDVERWWKREI